MSKYEGRTNMTYSSDTSTLEGLARSWGWVLFYGILTLILGIMVLVWPGASLATIAILFGLQLLVAGIFEIVAIFRHGESGGMRVLSAVLGVLSIIVGLWVLRNLLAAVGALAILLGIYWVVSGIIRTVDAIADSTTPARGWSIFGGLLSVIAGAVVFLWPGISLLTLIWVLGIWLVVWGIVIIVSSFSVRSAQKQMSDVGGVATA
jgi:uncharacterized membrane protein HdeD (DUF308 family)